MAPRRKIKWRAGYDTPVDKWRLHEAFLWGAKAQQHPGTVQGPTHPLLLAEFFEGMAIAGAGYIRMTADADPSEIVRRLKQDRELKLRELAERVADGPQLRFSL